MKRKFDCRKGCGNLVSGKGLQCKPCADKEHSIRMSGSGNSRYSHGRTHHMFCVDCGKSIDYRLVRCRPCHAKNIKGKYSGSKNPMWRGGVSFQSYPIEFNDELKARIRKRDNYTCQRCGMMESESNRNLDIHHIDYIKEHCTSDNLITLCRGCNASVNSNKKHWIIYFRRILCQN